jgi:predicted KAP-like P-loop ATPase
LFRRVNWLRAAKLTVGTGVSLALGLPPAGLLGEVFRLGKEVGGGNVDEKAISEIDKTAGKVSDEVHGLLKPKPDSSPPKEIHAIRQCFEDTLSELGITLVVLIDDLDRCLSETTISTLEAVRLFLFLKRTAFVIAADNEMIRHAVRRHFADVQNETLVTSYFDKLIQIPIRVPPLGTQDVRAYLMMLFVDDSTMQDGDKEDVRAKVCAQLGRTWQGKRVDRAFMQTLGKEFPAELISRFDTADRLAPLMTKASEVSGNPRLIKRFLNALAIRMAISDANGIGVDEAVLAKLLLFERCGPSKAYSDLIKRINEDENGQPGFLGDWEQQVSEGKKPDLADAWDDDFVREWLAVPPRLGEVDLRGAVYVSREHAPLISPEDRLSSEAAELLTALLEYPDMAAQLRERLAAVTRPEMTIILDRLLERARREQEWGTPPILEACLTVTRADPSQGTRLAAFLGDRPPQQIKPAIVKKVSGEPWAAQVFAKWERSDVSNPVKKAMKHGHVSV